jgi:sortase A
MSGISAAVTSAVLLLALTACEAVTTSAREGGGQDGSSAGRSTPHASPPRSSDSQPGKVEPRTTVRALPVHGRPRRSLLSIPAIGVRALPVLPYRGSPDDGPGTRIQNRGVAASPHGPRGGVGPGGIGNYLVTAHRLSSTRAFLQMPALDIGDRVHVLAGPHRYVYRISDTRSTSFRSRESLARQSAPVPGRPGRRPTQAMITLSTCATPEDHARGNYWADRLGNPEHRIDKIGTLVAIRPA